MVVSWLMRATRPRLTTALLFAFSVLVIPALIVVLVVSQYQAEKAIRAHLDAELGRTKADTTRALVGFFRPLIDVTSVVASAAALDPAAVRRDSFNDVLYGTLSNVDHIASIRVTFEDGFSRNFARITPELRASYSDLPAEAKWGARTYYNGQDGGGPSFAEVVFSDYPQVIASLTPEHMPDFLETAAYLGARKAESHFITDVTIGVATGLPVVSMAVPIRIGGVFSGAVTANVTVSDLSGFLEQNRISDHSESVILASDGQVIAASGIAPSQGQDASGEKAAPIDLDALKRRAMAFDALQVDAERGGNMHSYSVNFDGTEYSISDFPIENSLGLKYRALIITPIDDFIGDLRRSSRNFTMIMGLLLFFEAILMVRIARRMARRIKGFSHVIARIRGMEFDDSSTPGAAPPPVREMAELHSGISLLQSALRSFSLYVPLGVVRRLVEEGRPIAPGVDRREMTILFCDLENFSTMAQSISAEELLEYTSAYFSAATEAITRHGGTIDKFIGDAVMAFWGAPQQVSDHAVRACRAAVDIQRGVERLNQGWAAEGKRSLRVRVGVNSASVLVGNIGSPDRLSYTAIGDGVNVASRLEGKNKDLGSSICISDSTYERAKDQIVARPLKPVSVKGRVGEFMVYELLDAVKPVEAVREVA